MFRRVAAIPTWRKVTRKEAKLPHLIHRQGKQLTGRWCSDPRKDRLDSS